MGPSLLSRDQDVALGDSPFCEPAGTSTNVCTVKEGGTNSECFAANADRRTCEGKNTGVADANKCEFFANIKFDTVGWGGHRDEDDGGFPPGFASGDSADLLQLTCENCNLCDKDGICDSKEARLKLSICVGKRSEELV